MQERGHIMAVVAIDGPSGAGKSSVSRAIAAAFHWEYLDTGALYRALTFFALENQISSAHQIPALIGRDGIQWFGDPDKPEIRLSGRAINNEIRSVAVTDRVSEIAADPLVRSYLLTLQRTIINAASRGIVVEGRDIGTTVWPDAELKIFLTADLQARAERRNAELASSYSDSEIEYSLAKRDSIDSTRSASPLRKSDDQITIDATHLSLEEVVAVISKQILDLKLDSSGE